MYLSAGLAPPADVPAGAAKRGDPGTHGTSRAATIPFLGPARFDHFASTFFESIQYSCRCCQRGRSRTHGTSRAATTRSLACLRTGFRAAPSSSAASTIWSRCGVLPFETSLHVMQKLHFLRAAAAPPSGAAPTTQLDAPACRCFSGFRPGDG